MHRYVGSKLILVEGLTGSGKSIMAHFIARQLGYNGIAASWVHEGESPHPVLIDVETSIEDYMPEMLERWKTYANRIATSGEVKVVEACLFNNLIEFLMAYEVESSKILRYSDALQAILLPLNPTLVYLRQEDIRSSLEQNFENRGEGFKDFVIQYATDTPLAKGKGWEGYKGMMMFWQEFVALTDELFQRYTIRKLRIGNSWGNWDDCNRQVMESLSIPLVLEPRVSPAEAMELVGVYRERSNGREFGVQYENGELTANLFLKTKTRLVRRAEKVFLAEGWHFEIQFEAAEGSSVINRMRIDGRDVDYLALVGSVAEKYHSTDKNGYSEKDLRD